MTYSPDFSSASPASNWVTPPSVAPSTDYAYPPDAYADASRTLEAVYVPTAPLMQAPAQDVYSSPAPQPTAGNVSATTDTYTPSFAKSSAPEEADVDDEEANKPMPFIGKHPTQTLLATGTGAFGGALIGGAAKHLFFSGESDDAKSASSGKTTTAAKTAAGWEFTGVHSDGVTPKIIKNTSTGFTYEIDQATKAVTTKNASGTVILSAGNSEFQQIGNNLTRNFDNKPLGFKTSKTNETYTKYTADIIELVSHKTDGILSRLPLPNHERYLYNKKESVVVVLNEKGEIKKLITGVVSGLQTRNQGLALFTAVIDAVKSIAIKPTATDLNTALSSFDTVLASTEKKKFIDKLTNTKLLAGVVNHVTKYTNYSQNPQDEWGGLQKQLVKLAKFDFDATLASTSSNGYYPDFNALNAQCKFVPESVAKAKEAAEKAAKEIKWGELVLPALAGAGIVGAGVFVVDFILQRRKSNVTTAEPEGA